MRKLYRCGVRHGQHVRRGKCKDRRGHNDCPANAHDPTPSRVRQAWAILTENHKANLFPRVFSGDAL